MDSLTRKEKIMLAALAVALLWGLGGMGWRIRPSCLRGNTPAPDLYRRLRRALPDPEFLAFRSSRPGEERLRTSPEENRVYLTRPLLPADSEIEIMEDGWIFFPRDYYTTINVNQAGVEELATLPWIGPITARRILEYRERYVGFIKLKALKKVRGIGDKTLQRMEGRVRLY
ncbi:MAG: helix-hairpin-helix domain-containing protein [Candidatus Euphemobacter frigidus]|nr:helix-hairpin-helix domain-containing protein [Candidatus Euphemobacter frigidus]